MSFEEIVALVKSHPIATLLTIGVASEIIWRTYIYVRKNALTSKRKVHEVLFFNEKGGSCLAKHLQNTHKMPRPTIFPDSQCRNEFCTSKHTHRIAYEMDQAQYSLDLAIYTLTSVTLIDAINRSLERGVIVRLISDHEMVDSSGSQIRSMVGARVPVRCPDSNSMMHHKFCVIDGEARVNEILELKKRKSVRPYNSILISGSVNWTRQGLGGNWENCIITSDKVLTKSFQAEFRRMWNAFKSTANTVSAHKKK
ncbi:mitochondrial cardiolipin hydrolase [Drosophila tropicalis]|uniref:mitochondrial cardiolipin hydrolase n=1 Tax=Drosophila tropicalis TaxID=46794 RepID=UPI0035ABC376